MPQQVTETFRFAELEQGTEVVKEKPAPQLGNGGTVLAICGEAEVGKEALLRRFLQGSFQDSPAGGSNAPKFHTAKVWCDS